MLRAILLLLALIILIAIALVYMGVLNFQSTPEGVKATVNPAEVRMETREVQVPVFSAPQQPPANAAQPVVNGQ